MNSIFEERGGTYTLGADGMLYPNLIQEPREHRPIGRWGRMHRAYLEAEHPGLYERLILNGNPGQASGRRRGASQEHAGKIDQPDGPAGSHLGRPESIGSAGMGSEDEQHSQPGRRNRPGRSYQYPVTRQRRLSGRKRELCLPIPPATTQRIPP